MTNPNDSAASPPPAKRARTSLLVITVATAALVGAVLFTRGGDEQITGPSSGATERSTMTTLIPVTTVPATTTTRPPTTSTAPTTTVPATTTAAPSEPEPLCDGSALAITGALEGAYSLYVFDLETSALTNLLPDGPVFPSSPAWAPTCEAIAFISVEVGTRSDRIHHLDLGTGDLTVLGEGPPGERLAHLTWSPEGDALAYSRLPDWRLLRPCHGGDSREGCEFFDWLTRTAVDVLVTETREVTTLLTLPTKGNVLGVADIAWRSGGGVTILYKSGLYNYDVIYPGTQSLTVDAIAGPKHSAHCCELSPEARYVAAASYFRGPTSSDDSQMRVVELSTGDSHDFTKDPDEVDHDSSDELPEGNRIPFSGWLESPSWSSDGTRVAFVHPKAAGNAAMTKASPR